MTSQEFVLWLKGFTEGVHEFNITPKQWDILKDKLKEVKDEPTLSFPIYPKQPNTEAVPLPHITTPMVQPFHLPSNDPYERFKTYCGDTNGVSLTVATGSSGTTTYNPSTTTIWNPSGSAWSYTSTLPQQPTTGSNQLELDFEAK
jgi:hypothetical protein